MGCQLHSQNIASISNFRVVDSKYRTTESVLHIVKTPPQINCLLYQQPHPVVHTTHSSYKPVNLRLYASAGIGQVEQLGCINPSHTRCIVPVPSMPSPATFLADPTHHRRIRVTGPPSEQAEECDADTQHSATIPPNKEHTRGISRGSVRYNACGNVDAWDLSINRRIVCVSAWVGPVRCRPQTGHSGCAHTPALCGRVH